jgi:hypothetical protein
VEEKTMKKIVQKTIDTTQKPVKLDHNVRNFSNDSILKHNQAEKIDDASKTANIEQDVISYTEPPHSGTNKTSARSKKMGVLVSIEGKDFSYDAFPSLRLRLTTPKTLRKSMARVMRMAVRGQMDMEKARSIAYLAMTLSALFKLESDLSVEREIQLLRREIQKLESEGKI